jgi:hypothetical protein
MTGIELIAAERKRQIKEEGWTAEHDDQHKDGELAKAAASYAYPHEGGFFSRRAALWPWADEWYKPNPDNRIRELEKAGALIAAEIDRLLRLEEKTEEEVVP